MGSPRPKGVDNKPIWHHGCKVTGITLKWGGTLGESSCMKVVKGLLDAHFYFGNFGSLKVL